MPRKSLWKCQSGNFGIMFAFAVLPILAGVGLAVDYARAESARGRLTSSVDATALALAHASVNLTQAEMQARARQLFDGNFAGEPGTLVGDIDIERSAAELTVGASAQVQTTFLKLFNVATLDVTSQSKVTWGGRASKVEIVLALDNTGSMKGDKLDELKTAAKELIDSLETVASTPGAVKIGLVPFATTVRVNPSDSDYKTAPWIRFDDVTEWYRNRNGDWRQRTRSFSTSDWEGCIQDRDQSNDVTDILSGKTVGYETDKGNTLYPAIEGCPSQERNLQTIQPLTTDLGMLKDKIEDMTAAGNTNVTIGISWGLAMLSNAAPFTEGAAADDSEVAKYLIVLTDGENTQNRFSSNTNAIDARTKLACKSARDAGTVFTIRVIDGDKTLLEDCASKDNNGEPRFHDVQSADELPQVFRSIANEIANLRIAS